MVVRFTSKLRTVSLILRVMDTEMRGSKRGKEIQMKQGKSLIELETEIEIERQSKTKRVMKHLYIPQLRPASSFTLPSGVKWNWVEAPVSLASVRKDIPTSKHTYGVIEIDRALSAYEQEHFDLVPVSQPNYWLQTQAPAGNWVDSIGSSDLETLLDHSDHLQDSGEECRIIERTDVVIK